MFLIYENPHQLYDAESWMGVVELDADFFGEI